MRDNLEHGWIVNDREKDFGDIIGYCEDCGKPIYENTNYKKVYGAFYCEDCTERPYVEEEEW